MTRQIINTDTEANKIDAKIIEQLTRIKLKPDKDYFYNVIFGNKKKPDFLIKNLKDNKKYTFIIENKLRYRNLLAAKKQALDYADFLFNKKLLTDKFILIITDLKTFYVSKYEGGNKISYLEDINYIDCTEDLTADFFKSNSNLQEPVTISLQNQRSLKDIFDKINNKLRAYGLSSDQRMHLTMAFLFLKLIKENSDLFGETKHIRELKDNLGNLDLNITETNISNVFETISKIFEKKFSFSIKEYLGSKLLVELFAIVKELNLDSYDLDVKGEAFEYFINYGSIKSDIGEYFTPRHIVKFMIKCLNEVMKDRWLTNNKGQLITYFDPTCGTGGFLINIFKQLKKEIGDDKKLLNSIKTKCVWGVELSKRTSEIAKMNMILAGDGHTNIMNYDFLNFKQSHKQLYDVSIGNMPFGKKINEPAFVEGFLDVIKDGGYSIFIVPSGIIGTVSKKDYIQIREKLLTKGKLIKLVSLPQGVFLPYTFSKTYIIFWKKEKPTNDYDIEFVEIDNDGFTLNNQRDAIKGDSDLEVYFKDKNKLVKRNKIFNVSSNKIFNIKEFNEQTMPLNPVERQLDENKKKLLLLKKQISEIKNEKQIKEKRERIKTVTNNIQKLSEQKKKIEEYKNKFNYSLKFSLFNPFLKNKEKKITNLLPLEKVAEITRGPFGSSIKKSVCVAKGEGEYKIYEQGNIIKNDFSIGQYYITKEKYEELKRFKIEKDNLLMTCAGTLGRVALVPAHFEKGIFNSVLMRFKINQKIIRPKYLKLILQSDKIQNLLVRDCIGVGIKNMIPTKEVNKIKIPVPGLKQQDRLIAEVEAMGKKINKHLKQIEEIKNKQTQKLNLENT